MAYPIHTMAHPLLEDAFAASAIDQALEDLGAALEPEDQAWLREELAMLLDRDPHLRDAFAGARPHAVAQSGLVAHGEDGVITPEKTGTAGD